jgi:hypothetical protein
MSLIMGNMIFLFFWTLTNIRESDFLLLGMKTTSILTQKSSSTITSPKKHLPIPLFIAM